MRLGDLDNLYQRYGAIVLRRARSILKDDAAAKDVMQDVFVQMLKNAEDFERAPSTIGWLYQATTYQCLNTIRNATRRSQLLARNAAEDSAAESPELRLTVAQVLERVPEELRDIAIYHYVDHMTHEEIAGLLGVSRRTVGNRLEEFRTRARAADVLLPEGVR
jgi:RNA polymerase sigma-70 factor, ECF subfamily